MPTIEIEVWPFLYFVGSTTSWQRRYQRHTIYQTMDENQVSD